MNREVEPGQPIIPAAGSHRPAVVQVRLIAPADAIDAAAVSLADFYGGLWQPGSRGPSRRNPNDVILYGTVIVAVPNTSNSPARPAPRRTSRS